MIQAAGAWQTVQLMSQAVDLTLGAQAITKPLTQQAPPQPVPLQRADITAAASLMTRSPKDVKTALVPEALTGMVQNVWLPLTEETVAGEAIILPT